MNLKLTNSPLPGPKKRQMPKEGGGGGICQFQIHLLYKL